MRLFRPGATSFVTPQPYSPAYQSYPSLVQ